MNETDDKQLDIENSGWRFLCLFFSVLAGLGFYLFLGRWECVDDFLKQLAATIPTLAVLWYFRTYDIRQQIAKTGAQIERADMQITRTDKQIENAEAQIQQGNLVNGLNKLITNDLFDISVGIEILIDVSNNTKEFNSQILRAFVQRLHYLPGPLGKEQQKAKIDTGTGLSISIADTRIPYAMHIFKWMVENLEPTDGIRLNDLGFVYEEFSDIGLQAVGTRYVSLDEIKRALNAVDIAKQREIYGDNPMPDGEPL